MNERPPTLRAVCTHVSLALIVLSGAVAQTEEPTTVQELYMGLSSGPLAHAVLVDLPGDLAMRAGEITITRERVNEAIASEPLADEARAALEAEAFHVLETISVEPLLTREAREWAATQAAGTVDMDSNDAVIDALLQHIAEQVTVTDEDALAFFKENQDMLGERTYESIKDALLPYVRREKQQDAVRAHIGSLSSRTPVQVDAAFVAEVAPKALAGVVDQARRSGRPTFVDFGAKGCQACEMMEPILAELTESLAEQANVLLVSVVEHPYLSSRYGVRAIPVQIIFDAEGREVYRHTGFLSKAAIMDQLGRVGVQ